MGKAMYLMGLALVAAVGCSDKNRPASDGSASANDSVLEVTAPTPVATYTPAPAPVIEPAPAPAPLASSGGSYTVKKGDTLYGIAKAKYGDGKQWKRLAEANPGVNPQALKVGQVLTVP